MIAHFNVGNGLRTVSESKVSNTELSEFSVLTEFWEENTVSLFSLLLV